MTMAGLDTAYHPDGRPVRWYADEWARLRVRRDARLLQDPTGIRRFATAMQMKGPQQASLRAATHIMSRYAWLRDHLPRRPEPEPSDDPVV